MKWRMLLSLFVLGLLNVLASFILLNLKINNAPEIYFPSTAPAVVFDKSVRDQFPQDQNLVALFSGTHLFGESFLSGLDKLVKVLETNRLVERVITVTTQDRISGTEDVFIVERLIDPDALTPGGDSDRRKRVLGDRFAPGLIVSVSGDAIAVVIRPIPLQDSFERTELVNFVQQAISDSGLSADLNALAGQVALDAAQLDSMIRDSLLFIPATTVVGLLLIWWLYRRWLAVILTMIAMGTIVSISVAIISAWDRPYTLVSSMLPPLMAALCVALLVHLFNALSYASQRGYCGQERVIKAIGEIRIPALFTALTTAAGLLSLGFSPIVPIETFGIASGLSVLLLYPIIIWLLPPLVVYWDKGTWSKVGGSVGWIDRLVRWCAHTSIRHAKWVLVTTLLVVMVCAPFILKVTAETDLYQFFDEDHALIKSTKTIESKLTGVTSLEIVLDGKAPDSLKDPARLGKIKSLQTWLESLPEVDRTISMVEIIEEMNWAFHAEDENFRVIPANRDLISQYLFIYDGRDLYDLVDTGFQRTRLIMNLNVHGANAIQEVITAISAHLDSNPPADLDWFIAGLGRLFADQEELLVDGQIRSLGGALALIMVLMLVLWRSLPATLLCMIPNVSPVIFIFIIMGVLDIWLDMATAMIASVAIGVAVDDTIHIYYGYVKRARKGLGVAYSLLRTYRQAGRAVTTTTIILCTQFLLLTGSAFVPTTEFGLLTSIGLLAALVFDLLLLPALLVVFDAAGKGNKKPV